MNEQRITDPLAIELEADDELRYCELSRRSVRVRRLAAEAQRESSIFNGCDWPLVTGVSDCHRIESRLLRRLPGPKLDEESGRFLGLCIC